MNLLLKSFRSLTYLGPVALAALMSTSLFAQADGLASAGGGEKISISPGIGAAGLENLDPDQANQLVTVINHLTNQTIEVNAYARAMKHPIGAVNVPAEIVTQFNLVEPDGVTPAFTPYIQMTDSCLLQDDVGACNRVAGLLNQLSNSKVSVVASCYSDNRPNGCPSGLVIQTLVRLTFNN